MYQIIKKLIKNKDSEALKKSNLNKMAITSAFLVCFIAASLLPKIFIITRANHEHDYDGVDSSCETCIQIQNAVNLLKQFNIAIISSILIFFSSFTVTINKSVSSNIALLTPVMLKTRMNN